MDTFKRFLFRTSFGALTFFFFFAMGIGFPDVNSLTDPFDKTIGILESLFMWQRLKPWLLHGTLFILTFISTSWAQGKIYAVSIMTILLAHELAHYFICRRYGVAVTFPMFIPMPNVLGTMGAVIAMKGRIPNRKALFDIGVSGPLMGLIIALPAVVLGLYLSEIHPKPDQGTYMIFGEPLLFKWISYWLKGPIPEGQDIFLHPIAFAGWAALFVTSINLFPAGQLDGGHMIHALFGPRIGRWVSWTVIAFLIFLGTQYHVMWYFFALIILFLVFRAPHPVDESIKPDRLRWFLALITYVLMVLCFTPVPFELHL